MTLPGPAAAGGGGLPAGRGERAKAMGRLESTRNGHAHTSRPGRLAAVSASAWACRRSSRLTCAPLFCALVIPNALFTIVLRSGSSVSTACSVRRTPGGRCRTRPAPMPPQPLSVATKAASARWRKNATASVGRRANGPSLVAQTLNVTTFLRDATAEKSSICLSLLPNHELSLCLFRLVLIDLVARGQLM